LLDRIIARLSAQTEEGGEDGDVAYESFLKLARAHNDTTGRLAQLMRTRQMISGGAGDELIKSIVEALDTLSEHFKQTL
jgi:hypothetical protein